MHADRRPVPPDKASSFRWKGLLAAGVFALICAPVGAAAATGEVVDQTKLRVCADPGNLPFSNDKGEGFENKIAELIADELGVPLDYTWFPQTVGFVRMTLAARKCDLIIGVATTNELMQNSNPYYHSTYVMVHRPDSGIRPEGLDDPVMKTLKIGTQPRTPVASMLAQRGLLTRLKSYRLVVDTRLEKPVREMVSDVASGEIDVALAWGPLAGYWAREVDERLVVTPLKADPGGARLAYRVSMGLRYNEPDWKHRLNAIIEKRQDDINAILAAYGVPLLDNRGAPLQVKDVQPAPQKKTDAAPEGAAPEFEDPIRATVEEPDDYRLEAYRAAVPAGLSGATTVTVGGLRALLDDQDAVLIDVFPAPRKPEKLSPTAIWNEPRRETLKGAIWMANMGFGRLHEDEDAAFRMELRRLAGDADRALVFFCEPDCWMSWNAARRALDSGVARVVWFPGGVTDWKAAGGALETVRPWRPGSSG